MDAFKSTLLKRKTSPNGRVRRSSGTWYSVEQQSLPFHKNAREHIYTPCLYICGLEKSAKDIPYVYCKGGCD